MHFIIDARYLRERPSGIGAYVEALVDRLPNLAPEDSFDFWAHRLARKPLSEAANATETRIPVEPNSLWTVAWPQYYASFEGADLFHGAHNILPSHVPCPSVVTIHDLLPIEYPRLAFRRWEEIPKRVYFVRAQWRALRRATRLIVTTNAMADRVRCLCPEASRRVDVIPLGIGREFRPPDNRAAVRRRVTELVGFDAPYFLVVGQYAPNKRHDLALSAFAEHVPEPWRLIFVQRQTRRAPLADLADKLGVADRVSWFSHLELGDLIQLYQAASGLVQPSLYEGFGIPLLEAMACGCPVVATDMPMFREVLGPAGLLVGKNGSDGFGQALASLAKSEGWRNEVSEAGIERAAQFSWDRCAESTLHVLRSAAGGVSSATARTHAAV